MFNIRRYKNDWLLALGIIGVVAAIYGTAAHVQGGAISENTLTGELRAIRSAITTFNYVNGRSPKDLMELADGIYKDARGRERRFLPDTIRREGYDLIDPFGKPYRYDPKRGWVTTSADKYSEW